MNTRVLSMLTTTAVLLSGGAAFSQAQELQQVPAAPQPVPEMAEPAIGYQPTDWNSCPSCQTQHVGGHYAGGAVCCQNGGQNCPMGMCVDDDSCLTRSCLSDTCLGRFCATKAYPDSGWAPPVRLPVNRDQVWYGNYLPQAFYGNPGGGFIANYPQVYQPTDTTQLGYYYHHVPTWQSRPGMIPPTPNPADFHARMCLHGSHCHSCLHRGHVHNVHNVHCPQCGPFHAHNQPAHMHMHTAGWHTQSVQQRPARPVTARSSGSRNVFRLSSLSDLLD